MRIGDLLDPTSANAVDAAWLYHLLEPVSAFGRRAYDEIRPYRGGEEAQAQANARALCGLAERFSAQRVDAMRDALRSCPDPLPAISRAAMGETLEDAHLLELLRFLGAAQSVELIEMPPSLTALAEKLERGRSGRFGFYLSDALDASLSAVREQADRAQAEFESARGRLAQRVAKALGREEIPYSEFIVMRGEGTALPREVRVVREAPTYFLCELELDEPALEALRRRDAAEAQAAAAEDAVRAALSQGVREAGPELQRLLDALAQSDVRLAQIRFAHSYDCTAASVTPELRLKFTGAEYLPLKSQLQMQGRSYEPLSIDLAGAAVLTGPNMGGKSAALRTCAFVAMLVAFGVPVPAQSVECAIFEEIAWLGIGAQEDAPGGLLSSFAAEVVRLNEILARPDRRMLFLLDEFARTTTPHEGRALLVAVLRGLRRRGMLAFAATHLGGVARDAGARHFAVRGLRGMPAVPPGGDLLAALDALASSMDYSVEEVDGERGLSADAIALAELLGLDEDIVIEAKESVWTR
jgi:DNA mismatch repair protein MutS2